MGSWERAWRAGAEKRPANEWVLAGRGAVVRERPGFGGCDGGLEGVRDGGRRKRVRCGEVRDIEDLSDGLLGAVDSGRSG